MNNRKTDYSFRENIDSFDAASVLMHLNGVIFASADAWT